MHNAKSLYDLVHFNKSYNIHMFCSHVRNIRRSKIQHVRNIRRPRIQDIRNKKCINAGYGACVRSMIPHYTQIMLKI